MAEKVTEIPAGDQIPVFTRPDLEVVSADIGVVAYLGRDFEMSLLALSPRLVTLDNPNNGSPTATLQAAASYRETARIRFGPPALAQIAAGLLSALRNVEPETFEQTIADLMRSGGEADDPVH